MTALTDYFENALIDFLFRAQTLTLPSNFYVGLFTAAPGEAGGGTEVSGGSYARVAVTRSLANFSGTQSAGSTTASSGTGGQISNNISITFPAPTANWGVITHVAVFDAASGGNMVFSTQLVDGSNVAAPKTVNSGDAAPSFPAGSLKFQIDN